MTFRTVKTIFPSGKRSSHFKAERDQLSEAAYLADLYLQDNPGLYEHYMIQPRSQIIVSSYAPDSRHKVYGAEMARLIVGQAGARNLKMCTLHKNAKKNSGFETISYLNVQQETKVSVLPKHFERAPPFIYLNINPKTFNKNQPLIEETLASRDLRYPFRTPPYVRPIHFKQNIPDTVLKPALFKDTPVRGYTNDIGQYFKDAGTQYWIDENFAKRQLMQDFARMRISVTKEEMEEALQAYRDDVNSSRIHHPRPGPP